MIYDGSVVVVGLIFVEAGVVTEDSVKQSVVTEDSVKQSVVTEVRVEKLWVFVEVVVVVEME